MDSPFIRTTRSNKVFSSWGPPIAAHPSFDFLPALYSAMFCNEEGPADDAADDTARPSTSPLPNETEALLPDTIPAEMPSSQTTAPSRKAKLKAAGHARRKRRKKQEHTVDAKIKERFPEDAPRLAVEMSLEEAKVASSGFVALNRLKENHRIYSLEELTGKDSAFKFTLQKWNGREPRLILDKNNIICAILAGCPTAEDWPTVHQDAAKALEQARLRSSAEHAIHRRGAFPTLRSGISHGGGQRFPMNVANKKGDKEIIDELNGMECFIRIANFATAVMARRAPALCHHYESTLQKLQDKDPSLRRAFPDSAFAATTYNLGPETVCFVHQDLNNYACGMCAVTPVGCFDPEKGGHLVLWDCKVVVEFPPGSTILLPSAVIAHSNCSIAPTETRYSFTQYSAGALFRWVSNGFQRSVDFMQSLSKEELREEEEKKSRRWEEGLMLLPRVKAPASDNHLEAVCVDG